VRLDHTGSAVYTGWVRHRRYTEPRRVFRYPLAMAVVNLDELAELDRRSRLFGYNRFAPVGFRDRDYLLGRDEPLRGQLNQVMASRGRGMPSGPMLLLTGLRTLGSLFNPVSLYYCGDQHRALSRVVAEVNNTFGERYCYLLDSLEPAGTAAVRAAGEKVFHVSPFQETRGEYRFTVGLPGESLVVHIEYRREDDPILDATLSLRRRAFDSRSLLRMLALAPLNGVRTLALIHWQALKLWLGKAKFHPKPPPPAGELRARQLGGGR